MQVLLHIQSSESLSSPTHDASTCGLLLILVLQNWDEHNQQNIILLSSRIQIMELFKGHKIPLRSGVKMQKCLLD